MRKIKTKIVETQAKKLILGENLWKIRSKNVKTQTKKSNFNFKFKKIEENPVKYAKTQAKKISDFKCKFKKIWGKSS